MTIVAWTALVLSLVANVILLVNSFNKEADEEHINNIVKGVCNMCHDTMSMIRIMSSENARLSKEIEELKIRIEEKQ